MNILVVEGLTKTYGERVLFEDITFGLEQGSKTALIARNGEGKSTLMKIIAGRDQADSGKITMNKNSAIGFLEQDPVFNEKDSIINYIFKLQTPAMQAVKEYERLQSVYEETQTPEIENQLHEAIHLIDTLKAWDIDSRVQTVLGKLGLVHIHQPVSTLSGGQKRRIALAQLLIESPDLLLMDEPTNHLDVEMVEWLESYLSQQQITLLLVTHDRYFLDRVCDEIIELDAQTIFRYHGDYEYFLEKKAERAFNESREDDKARSLLRKELEWVRRQPKARTAKSKSRVDGYYELKEKTGGKKEDQKLELDIKMNRIGGKVIELKKVYKSFGDLPILKGFDYTFKKGERIGIIGKNGVGKTTFLDMISGKAEPDSGKINLGETIIFGYYTQTGLQFKDDKRVIEVVKDIADMVVLNDKTKVRAEQFLELFQFPPKTQHTFVSKLSGGEKRRLMLLTVLIKNPNFLILDEPTNDLDLLTLRTLEDYLEFYPGCMVIVSHDRYFMDKLVDHLFVFEGNGEVRDFPGNYSSYRASLVKEEEDKKKLEKAANVEIKKEKAVEHNLQKEKNEFKKLEKEISKLEEEKNSIEISLADIKGHEELMKLTGRLGQIISELDQKGLRWLELSEKI